MIMALLLCAATTIASGLMVAAAAAVVVGRNSAVRGMKVVREQCNGRGQFVTPPHRRPSNILMWAATVLLLTVTIAPICVRAAPVAPYPPQRNAPTSVDTQLPTLYKNNRLQNYLTKFGYLEPAADGALTLYSEHSLQLALQQLQQYAHIPVTGILDEKTIKLLQKRRCGLPDQGKYGLQTSGRRKRYTLHGQRWPYTNLTWSLRNYNLPHLNTYDVRLVISKALEVWSRHSRLTFTEVDNPQADILIYFYSGPHGDNFPFDGKGVILAHAFFPNGGRSVDVHFDADESWTTTGNSDEGTNLFNVAAHEFGHSLGLSHSSQPDALMYPWYKDMEDGFNFELPDDDKIAIQALYGTRTIQWAPIYTPPTTTTTTTTTTSTTTQVTPTRGNALIPPGRKVPLDPHYGGKHHHTPYGGGKPPNRKPMHPDKKKKKYPGNGVYGGTVDKEFSTTSSGAEVVPAAGGRHIWNETPSNPRPKHNKESDKPDRDGPVPEICDTSFDAVSVIRREVFFFKDQFFWRFTDKLKLLDGYPAEIIRLWHGLPTNLTHVDAVYERPDGKIVFFVGRYFYVFAGNYLDPGYPKPITALGLPEHLDHIDAAMVWGHNGKTYFYSGSSYWKFDEDANHIELDYPRSISVWRGVGRSIDAVFQWQDGQIYFFKDKSFWRFNDAMMQVVKEKPRLSSTFWFRCPNSNLTQAGGGRHSGEAAKNLPYLSSNSNPVALTGTTNHPSQMSVVMTCTTLIAVVWWAWLPRYRSVHTTDQ